MNDDQPPANKLQLPQLQPLAAYRRWLRLVAFGQAPPAYRSSEQVWRGSCQRQARQIQAEGYPSETDSIPMV
jgi:hypothetical protein